MRSISDMPKSWAESDSISEATAFEQALKRISPTQKLSAIEQENAELRLTIKQLTEENQELRAAIQRTCEEDWDV